jgi:hypothetical protein
MRVLIPNVFSGEPPETSAQRASPPEPGSLRAKLVAELSSARMTVADVDALAAFWKEVDAYFRDHTSRPMFNLRPPDRWLAVSVDVTTVIERIERWDDPSLEQLPMPYGRGAVMQVEFLDPGTDEATSGVGMMPERFIDQLWLAMNLAVPGSLDLAEAFTIDPEDNDDLPRLSAYDWANAATTASIEGWPEITRLPFATTWEWLHSDMLYDLEVAETPSQIALVTLLQVGRRSWLDPANVLSIAQALEALLAAGRESIGSTLRNRIETILGAPTERKNWFQKFYDTRSRIVHGAYPHIRPAAATAGVDPRRSRYERDFPAIVEDGLRVQIALPKT